MIRRIEKPLHLAVEDLSRWLTYTIFLLPLTFAFLQELLGLPGAVKYLVDAAWVILALIPVLRGRLRIRQKLLPFAVVTALFVGCTLLVYLFRYQSVFYYLWGLRNYLRLYVAFFAFAAFFSGKDAESCLNILDRLFTVNLLACLYQFLRGYEQDCIGGIFGTAKGCNGYLVVYLTIVVCRSVLQYMNGREKTAACFYKSAVSLTVAAVAELKFFYIVFIAIMAMGMVLTRFSLRKVLLFAGAAVLVSAAAAVLGTIYSYFEGFLSLRSLLAMLQQTNYASDTDMGRFNGISFLSERFLTTVPLKLFGMGLGNCDTGAIDLVNTAFHTRYVDLHYSIFSYTFLFIENGFLGLLIYCSFFLLAFRAAVRALRRKDGERLYAQMAVVMSVLCGLLMFYNSSLRTEAGYMIYFVLALPLMERRKAPDREERR